MLKNICISGITAAIVAFGVVACSDGGGEPTTIVCSADGDCRVGEICHPTGKVCVQTCTAGEDCPDASKNCAEISATDTQKICKCTTTPLCQGGVAGADSICSETFDVCAPKCATNTDCPAGYDCDSATGDCNPSAGNTDAGACAWDSCSSTSFTSGAKMCGSTGCAAGASCTGTGQSTCTGGSFCSGGACGYSPYPTQAACANFHSGQHASGPTWNPGTSTGPVIYALSEISHGQGTTPAGGQPTGAYPECTTDSTQWNFKLRAYRTDMDWPATRAGLSGFKYVPVSGNDVDILGTNTLLLPNIGYNRNSANLKDAEFNVYVCADNAMNDLQPGFYFVGGNEVCGQF